MGLAPPLDVLQERIGRWIVAEKLWRRGPIPEPLLQNLVRMKWTGIYLVGYVIMLGGIIAALWKSGVIARIGSTWTLIGVVIAIGIGIMIAVANSGKKESINIER